MLIENLPNDFQAHGIMKARKSSIKLSAKTFKMHIDAQYSKKIEAPVRELASNAWDSHLRAGNDKPFYVQAPTALHPEFAVRDYGVGMTDQVMEEVYIVLGESDKDTSNDEVGMWGHGAQAPYAYCDQYMISCYDGETVRHYGYGLAEDSIPTLYLMNEEPCDEPRGVRVAFAVEARDFDAFEKAIREVALAHNGAFETNVKLGENPKPKFAGDDWFVVDECALQPGWYARQGCVIYPIARDKITLPKVNYDSKSRFIIDCPIGTVKVTPSRESIEYSEEVVAYLNNRIERLREEVAAAIWEAIKDIKSVKKFFAKAKELTPTFVTGDYTHPITDMKSTVMTATGDRQFVDCFRQKDGRWDFTVPQTFNLETGPNGRVVDKYLILNDGSSFLDASRDPASSSLSFSEQRRIARFVRSYMERNSFSSVMLIMNYAEPREEFWAACFGDRWQFVSFEELRDAMPRRVSPVADKSKPPIRGLAFAKAAGEQKPVFEIKADEGKYAWISSAQHRRQAGPLFKLAKSFGLDALYIAAPQAQHEMDEHSIPHLRAAVDLDLKGRGSSFDLWYHTHEIFQSSTAKAFVKFLQLLTPQDYERLEKGSGNYSEIAKYAKGYLGIDLSAIKDDEKKVLDALVVDNNDRVVTPICPKEAASLKKALAIISDWNFHSNPASGVISNLHYCKEEPAEAHKYVGLLIHLQNVFPPKSKA